MAKVLFTAVVADMRNKLNGSVFSKNRYGAYIRTKVTPVNPQTVAQQQARAILSANSSAWRGLTDSERKSWIDGAPNFPFSDIFGNSKQLSGQTLFVKLNNNLQTYNGSSITDAPLPVSIPTLTALSLTAAAGTPAVSIVFAASPVPANMKLVLFATPQITPGISFVKNRFRFLHTLAAAATTPYNALTAYTALHGTLVAGQKIYVKAFFVSTITGQAGIPLTAEVTIAA